HTGKSLKSHTMGSCPPANQARRACRAQPQLVRRQADRQPKKRLALSSHEASCGLCLLPPASRLSCSSCSSFFCLPVRFTGVSTATLHNKSPGAFVRTDCTPLPRKRNLRPLWVSGDTRSDTLPSKIGRAHV